MALRLECRRASTTSLSTGCGSSGSSVFRGPIVETFWDHGTRKGPNLDEVIVSLPGMSDRKDLLAPRAVVTWLLLAGAGFFALTSYELRPGQHADATPGFWPSVSTVKPVPNAFNLLLFAHPKCPCTRATLGELAALMAQCEGKLTAHVLFLLPASATEGWEKTDLWSAAQMIPGARCATDRCGKEAELFGIYTSGQALLYDPVGHLLFVGGITGARGHSGDNAGRATIASLVKGERPVESSGNLPVFGCPIRETDGVQSPRDP